eukprot:Phypoly_transcript_19050.p1 GENE.Phypoly_transcript_19050~~Phypoly_transcript_19050.p1  ORF type:complete len:135 (+),score=22.87 Phypoly_transcript_19050:77-481(+)
MEEHHVVVARFISAAKKGEDEVVKEYLTDKEFNITPHEVDATGETALHWAARTGMISTVELLLSHGAKVNAKDTSGETPLHKAAWRNQTETVEVLIEHGASIDETSKDGKKPYDLATCPILGTTKDSISTKIIL